MSLLEALKLPSLSTAALPQARASAGLPAPPANVAGAPTADAAAPVPAAGMKAEDIAAAIMDRQVAILVGWQTALDVFDKTMTSSADEEAKPEFQKVVVGYFADKLMSAMMKHAPGASELDAVVKVLEGEYKRAATAKASATLRDFVVQHAKAIGRLHQTILKERQGFISAVQARREALEAAKAAQPAPKGGKGAKAGPLVTTPDAIAYGAMRIVLLDTFDSIDRILSVSNEEALFRVLSEEWIRHATVYAGMGMSVKGVVIIRLNPDYSVKNAHIQGTGGQKLAEQLLKDSESGSVDVFRLKAQRRILLLAANGWPSVILNLDENNGDLSTGAFAEGDTDSLRKYVMSKGLPPTTKLTGD